MTSVEKIVSFGSPFPDVEIPGVDVFGCSLGGITDAELDEIALIDGG
ncbi:hypothetical protein [Nocardia cerradoensis]|nr:hypothetical protein [Nocardia cerradoensis]